MEALSRGVSCDTVVNVWIVCAVSNYSSVFEVHSSDQCKVCCSLHDIIACEAISKVPFWSTARNQNLKPEKVWEPGCAFCLLLTQPVAKTMPCTILPLSQTPTVVPIPGNLLLLIEYLDTVSS